jgi:hypothetical protein
MGFCPVRLVSSNARSPIPLDDYEKFVAVFQKIRPEQEMPRNIPLRFYIVEGNSYSVLQDLFRPLEEYGNELLRFFLLNIRKSFNYYRRFKVITY